MANGLSIRVRCCMCATCTSIGVCAVCTKIIIMAQKEAISSTRRYVVPALNTPSDPPGPASLMVRQIVQPLTISSLLSFRPPSLAAMGTARYTARKFGDRLQEFVLAAEELILMVQCFQNIHILA